VQHDLLDSHPAADLRVYVVWFNMYPGDARWRWDGGGLVDPRVSHFWDERKQLGQWFSANLTHRPAPTWDFYALYGPGSTWGREPPPAVSSGGTLIGRRDALITGLAGLIGG
jgi:hypothetical protein